MASQSGIANCCMSEEHSDMLEVKPLNCYRMCHTGDGVCLEGMIGAEGQEIAERHLMPFPRRPVGVCKFSVCASVRANRKIFREIIARVTCGAEHTLPLKSG